MAYKKERGTDELPANSPIKVGSVPEHLLNITFEVRQTWKSQNVSEVYFKAILSARTVQPGYSKSLEKYGQK